MTGDIDRLRSAAGEETEVDSEEEEQGMLGGLTYQTDLQDKQDSKYHSSMSHSNTPKPQECTEISSPYQLSDSQDIRLETCDQKEGFQYSTAQLNSISKQTTPEGWNDNIPSEAERLINDWSTAKPQPVKGPPGFEGPPGFLRTADELLPPQDAAHQLERVNDWVSTSDDIPDLEETIGAEDGYTEDDDTGTGDTGIGISATRESSTLSSAGSMEYHSFGSVQVTFSSSSSNNSLSSPDKKHPEKLVGHTGQTSEGKLQISV